MSNIFPNENGTPGNYPEPIEEIKPTAAEMADPALKDIAMHLFKTSKDNSDRQKLYILSEKSIIMSMLKESLTEMYSHTKCPHSHSHT